MGVPTDTRTAVGVSVTLLILVTAGRLAQRAAHPTPVNIAQCPRLSQTSETDRPCCWLCRHPVGDHLQANGQRVVSLQSFRGHFVCIRWPCPGRVVCTHTLACDGRGILATENGMCVTVCAASSHDPPSSPPCFALMFSSSSQLNAKQDLSRLISMTASRCQRST